MATLSRRLRRAMPDWMYALWQYRPVLMTFNRLARRIDGAEVAAYGRGARDVRAELAIEHLAERIAAGPSVGRHQRITSTGIVLGLAG